MKSNTIKGNFLFQMLYQLIILIVPLILNPYLTRTLGDSSLGIYSYTYSVVMCFMMAAKLGIDKYGQRLIASVRDDEILMRKAFWSLYTVHFTVTLIVMLMYIVFVVFVGEKYRTIYVIHGLALASVLLDVSWFFYGIESIKAIIVKNLGIKLAESVLIFIFVNAQNDLLLYTLIMALSLVSGNFVILLQALRVVKPIKFEWGNFRQHFRPLFVLFMAVIATTLYQILDKTLLGIFSTEREVAYYEYANKIINVPVNIIYVLGTVLMPRMCFYADRGDRDKQNKYVEYSLHFVSFLGIGFSFGFLSVSELFAKLYYGEAFSVCGKVMMALSPLVILFGLESIVRTQYMIPNHMDKQLSVCLWITAFTNILISVKLVPSCGVYGAVIGTVIAEFICTVLQFFCCRSVISIIKVIKTIIPYTVFGAIMYMIIFVIKCFWNISISHLIFQITIGILFYCLTCMIYLLFASNIKLFVRIEVRKVFAYVKHCVLYKNANNKYK